MPEEREPATVRIPFIIREQNTLLTYRGGALFEADKPSNSSAEKVARRFIAQYIGLAAVKALGPVGRIDDVHGYALYPSIEQSLELSHNHQLLLASYDIDDYLEATDTHDPINLTFARRALERSRNLR